MLVGAATATGTDPTIGRLILAGIILAGVSWYVFACWFFPFRSCPWCGGSGRWHQPGQKGRRRGRRNFRACWVCKGTGKRLRLGRRAYNFVARTWDSAR